MDDHRGDVEERRCSGDDSADALALNRAKRGALRHEGVHELLAPEGEVERVATRDGKWRTGTPENRRWNTFLSRR